MFNIIDFIKVKTRPLRRGPKQWYQRKKQEFILWHRPKQIADQLFEQQFGYKIDWDNPRDLNEKIQWLMFNTDISEWVRLADKYRVREFVKARGCEEILIPLYGKWERAEDIDWDKLPNSFVMKVNHGCGDAQIVLDKTKADLSAIQQFMKNALKQTWGLGTAEIHYRRIKPCIIAEQLLLPSDASHVKEVNGMAPTATMTDYKIWCFNGNPYCIQAYSGRDMKTNEMIRNVYDWNWNKHPEYYNEQYRSDVIDKKPEHLKEMYEYACKLSKGFPEVRVDLYECNGKVYFGELTFTGSAGRIPTFTKEYLKEMGDQIIIKK